MDIADQRLSRFIELADITGFTLDAIVSAIGWRMR